MYRGTILQYLRKYIRNLHSDQLESYILAGECTLHAIELEPSAIKDWVGDILPYTLEVERVFCSKVEIKIPWAQIKSKPVLVSVHEMEITGWVHDFREQEWNMSMAGSQRNKLISERICNIESYDSSKVNLKQLELGWMDYVFSGAQIRVEFCKLNMRTRSISRLPPSGQHTCSEESPYEETTSPSIAFTAQIEGLLIAPCHSESGDWTVTYVDTPELVYQFDYDRKILQLTRLVTMRNFSVFVPNSDSVLVDHSPGFRMKIVTEYHCVNLNKHAHHKSSSARFAIAPFACSTNVAVWLDRVNIKGSCVCEIASFWALLQDMICSVIVPAESLTPENRSCHYTFGEDAILVASAKQDLEAMKVDEVDLTDSLPSVTLPELPELRSKKNSKKSKFSDNSPKSTNVVGASSDPSIEIKRLLYGLAKEVKDNANRVTETTDKFMSQSKKIFSKLTGGKSKPKQGITGSTSVPSVVISDRSPRSPLGDEGSREISSSSSSSADEGFLDAVSESGDGEAQREPGGDGFGTWSEDTPVEGHEYSVSQLAVMDKICYNSFFHLHVNELVVVVREPAGRSLSISLRQMDLSTESQTPLTYSQLSVLAAFSHSPAMFLVHAKNLASRVLCPMEPVHAATAVTAAVVSVTGPANEVVLKLGGGPGKGLCLKWKSRTHPPTRLLGETGVVETGRVQPMEGCLHRVYLVTSKTDGLSNFYAQLMAFTGDFPDPSLDPEIRMRIFCRDLTVVSPAVTGKWKFFVPSAILSKSLKPGAKYIDLLSGFQTLSEIPPCHFSGGGNPLDSDRSTGFPVDGSFCSCICGQEKTSWSWVLPSIDQVPRRILFPGRVLSTAGIVAERTWKRMELAQDHVHVPIAEYTSLIESKLLIAEHEFKIQQLQEQYTTVSEELTRRNVALKEKWAAEAVQMGSKQTVVDILSEKVCVMERLVRDLTEASETAAQQLTAVRSACAVEVAETRRKLIEETQKLHHKLAECDSVQNALSDQVRLKEKEVDLLKRQREFLLGMGRTMDPKKL